MLERGALVSKQDSMGNTPMLMAVGKESINHRLLSLLLKEVQKEDKDDRLKTMNCFNSRGVTLLHYVLSMREEDTDLLWYLIDIGSDIEIKSRKANGFNALFYAAYAGNIRYVEITLRIMRDAESRKRYIESRDEYGRIALMLAAINNQIEVVLKLLELGASTESKDYFGNTLLMIAIESGQVEMALKIIELGANIEAKDCCGNRALMMAAENGQIGVVRTLIELGADKNALTNDRWTALMLAADSDQI